MDKKSLKQYCDEIHPSEYWDKRYKQYVPLFIKEASTKMNWTEWDDDVFKQFFEKRINCVASAKPAYFSEEEQGKIKEHWAELAPLLKKIADSQDVPLWDTYDEIKKCIRKHTKRNMKAATNRLIASLQPKLLCTIIDEGKLQELFEKLNEYSTVETDESIPDNWFGNNYKLFKLFRETLQYQDVMDIAKYPWELFDYFDKHKDKQSNMNNNSHTEEDNIKLIEQCVRLLETNKNLILTGAPGTGKTYLAKEKIAKAMGATKDNGQCVMVQFHPSYDYTDFVEGLRPTSFSNGNIGFERKDGVFKAFCKKAIESRTSSGVNNFDECWKKLVNILNEQDYLEIPLLSGSPEFRIELNVNGDGLANRTYPDNGYAKGEWIRGMSKFFSKEQLYNVYRGLPGIPSGGHDNYRKAIVQYMTQNVGLQPFSKGTESAVSDRKFVFIIDEINRGEISKIFGELFFSIDPGYRGNGTPVKTQYQNLITDESDPFFNGFYVPENVYIIGTMNDIDRSVESMDFAMRRRFAWKEIKAEDNTAMLNGLDVKDEAIARMKRLNAAIWDENENTGIEGLNEAYHIGGAYFKKLELYHGTDDERFQALWDNHLRGVLFEYLRGSENAEESLKTLKKAYFGTNGDASTEG